MKVNTRLLRLPTKPNALWRDLAHVANDEAKALATELRQQFRYDGCDEHPDETSVLTISAHWDGVPTIEKTDFCCEAHAEKYTFHDHQDGEVVALELAHLL